MNYIAAEKARDFATHLAKIHGEKDFKGMRAAGRLAAETLDLLVSHVKPGVTTGELDDLAYNFITKAGAYPAPLYYRGFPKSICTSINHVICHGIPGDKKLKAGDTLNIDVTAILDGWHGDTSRMFFVGKVSPKVKRLSDLTFEAMHLGINQAKPGKTLGDIGYAIQSFAESQKCSVVTDFCGHGLGRVFHDAPNILHYGRPGSGLILRPGMFFTIEPMINLGRPDSKVLGDGWTAVTRDRKLSMQFEHSIGITEDGAEIFTLSPNGFDKPPYSG
ncbi:MAG: type I methionyl aminopeptidase [Alphaproteobacteria bacterium]